MQLMSTYSLPGRVHRQGYRVPLSPFLSQNPTFIQLLLLFAITCSLLVLFQTVTYAQSCPSGGADITATGSTAKLPAAPAGSHWRPNGGNTATIDDQGNISGMTANGTYSFLLVTSGTTCGAANTLTEGLYSDYASAAFGGQFAVVGTPGAGGFPITSFGTLADVATNADPSLYGSGSDNTLIFQMANRTIHYANAANTYVSGTTYKMTVNYNPVTQLLTYTINNQVLSFNPGTALAGQNWASGNFMSATMLYLSSAAVGQKVEVTNIKLNGNLLANNSLSAENAVVALDVSGYDYYNGYTVTADVKYTYSGTPAPGALFFDYKFGQTNGCNNGDNGCVDEVIVTKSTPPTPSTLDVIVTPGACNTATNQYTLAGQFGITNPVAGTLTITDGTSTSAITITPSTTYGTFSFNENSGTGTHTVVATYLTLTNSQTYIAPMSCNTPVVCTPPTTTGTTICSPATTATVLPSAAPNQVWEFVSGPTNATIAQNGAVSGLTASGTYTFRITDSEPVGNGCFGNSVQDYGSNSNEIAGLVEQHFGVTGAVTATSSPNGAVSIADMYSYPYVVKTTAPFNYASGTQYPFTMVFNPSASGTSKFVFTINGTTVQWDPTTSPNPNELDVNAIRIFGTHDSSLNTRITIGNLVLNGNSIAGNMDLQTGSSTDDLLIRGYSISNGFTMTGTATFDWGNTAGNFDPTAQFRIKLDKTICSQATSCSSLVTVVRNDSPTAGTPVVTPATCNAAGTAANNDASIVVSGITNGTSYAFTTDGSAPVYTPAQTIAGGTITLSALANPAVATTYTIRVFNGSASCFTDVTAILNPKVCTPGCAIATTATPGTCAPATNQYTVSGTISLTSAVAGTATITDGTSTTTVAITAGTPTVDYSLAGLTSDGASHTVTVSLPGCGTATATYTAPASCTIATSIVVTSATVCYGNSATLVASSCAGTVSWNTGATGNTLVTPALTALTNYTATCTTASSTATAVGTVTVMPQAILSLQASSTLVTVNTPVSLSAIGCVGTINWSTGATGSSISVTPANATNVYSATCTTGPGCTAFASITITTVTPTCQLALVVTPGSCNSATNQYTLTGTVSATNAVGNQTITLTDGTTSTTLTLSGNGPASFTLTGLLSNGLTHNLQVSTTNCGTTSTSYTAPTSCSYTPCSPPVHVCKGTSYAIELSTTAGQSSYQWYRYGVAIQGATARSYTATQAGSYSVVINGNVVGQCPDGSCCPVVIVEDSVAVYQANTQTPTCTTNTANADGRILVSQWKLSNSDATPYYYQVSLGSSFNAGQVVAGGASVPVPADGVLATNLANPTSAGGQSYTIRITNELGCFRDVVVNLAQTNCSCPPVKCLPMVITKIR